MKKILLTALFCASLLHAEILVVTNKNSTIDKLSKETIQYIYLGKIDYIGNVKITPLLSTHTYLHNEFLGKIINKTYSQYNSYWTRLIFTGVKPFPSSYTKFELEDQLDKLNTITYIRKEDLKSNWKIIYQE